MPRSWADREIYRMLGPAVARPLATTHRHVVWEDPAIRLECNLVRNVATSQDTFAVRITPTADANYTSVVIPLAPDGRLHLVGRYRYAIDRWSIEFPRFDLDSSDSGWKDAAQLDLHRVAGLNAKHMNLLGAFQIDPALLSTSTVVILAQGCTRRRATSKSAVAASAHGGKPENAPDGEELIAGSLALPLAEMSQLVERGEIDCGVTLAALSLYQARLR